MTFLQNTAHNQNISFETLKNLVNKLFFFFFSGACNILYVKVNQAKLRYVVLVSLTMCNNVV